jgi:hypothetical protein
LKLNFIGRFLNTINLLTIFSLFDENATRKE